MAGDAYWLWPPRRTRGARFAMFARRGSSRRSTGAFSASRVASGMRRSLSIARPPRRGDGGLPGSCPPAPLSRCPRSGDYRVHQLIDDLPVFARGPAQAPFQRVTVLLQHARRSQIVGKHLSLDALGAKFVKRVLGDARQRFTRDSPAPVGLPYPVTHSERLRMLLGQALQTDTPDCLAIDVDCEL